jgi:hypothetical protein
MRFRATPNSPTDLFEPVLGNAIYAEAHAQDALFTRLQFGEGLSECASQRACYALESDCLGPR